MTRFFFLIDMIPLDNSIKYGI